METPGLQGLIADIQHWSLNSVSSLSIDSLKACEQLGNEALSFSM